METVVSSNNYDDWLQLVGCDKELLPGAYGLITLRDRPFCIGNVVLSLLDAH